MQILDHQQIKQKLIRLSYEILEDYYQESELIILGVNNTGQRMAELVLEQLNHIGFESAILGNIQLNPSKPNIEDTQISIDTTLENKDIIVIDDVANTGRTLFYACHPILKFNPKSLSTCVLVDRKHKTFPIHVDFVGLTLATTLQENISVELESDYQAYLD